jgi:hypothetical protein
VAHVCRAARGSRSAGRGPSDRTGSATRHELARVGDAAHSGRVRSFRPCPPEVEQLGQLIAATMGTFGGGLLAASAARRRPLLTTTRSKLMLHPGYRNSFRDLENGEPGGGGNYSMAPCRQTTPARDEKLRAPSPGYVIGSEHSVPSFDVPPACTPPETILRLASSDVPRAAGGRRTCWDRVGPP